MSWGAPPPGQNPYYGQQQGQPGGYQQPPPGGYQQQAPPGGYRGPPPAGYAGAPPQQRPPGGYAPPPQGAPQYGAPAGYGGYGGQAPPPSGYGGAPAGGPPQGYGAPQGGFAPPAPPPGVSPELWQWFQAVDQDRSGKITSVELQRALMNGNWTPFNQETCRLMIGMFDRDRSGTIDVHEFSSLWKYIQDWKGCFDRFDRDRSGNIDVNELQNAFRTFGYNLSMQFCQVCVRVFDKQNSNTMNFDNFIQCCVMLKSLTDQFRQKDTQQQGVINIQYEEFLRMVLDNTIR